ncbi:MAG TPA: iron-containing alcohol dehydrogenase [Sumerlaeia bacterium]|nr:iron-containing alcohol dehydrogenase [Sumerlaeia bacterium]
MENFEFYNPVKVIFGPGEVSRTGAEAKRLGKKALLVSYKDHAFFGDLLGRIQSMLRTEGVACAPFFEVTANPTLGQVKRGIGVCRNEGADFVLAVGGGSPIDAAKLIAAGVLYDGNPWNMIMSRHDKMVAVPPEKALPLMTIPTLPATGSEMNCGAVLTNEKTREKSYLFAECVYPKVSIVDPQLTCSLPPYQTACGAADAISHALETYINAVDDTPLQDRMLEGVMLVTIENVAKALEKPEDLAARANLQWAAIVAWNGWCQCGAGAWAPMHQLGHPLSARHDAAHGASLAVVMPAWMKYVHQRRLGRCVQFAERVFGIDPKGRDHEAVALEGIARFDEFLKRIGVPTRLSDVCVSAEEIESLTEDVARISFGENGALNSRPPVDRAGVRAIYELAL